MNEEKGAMKRPVRGVKVRSINFLMIFLSVILYVALLVITCQAASDYKAMARATETYIACQENAALVSDGSDYLTEQVRLFTVNLDPAYADNYFQEIHTTRRRQRALEQLDQQGSPHARDYLETALNHSNQLMEREIYAMRLAAESQGMDLSSFPSELSDAKISPSDSALSQSRKLDEARELVFGSEYQAKKMLITSNIDYFLADVLDSTQGAHHSTMEDLNHTMLLERIFFSLLFVGNVMVFLMIIFLIVKPLQVYVNCIKEEKLMEITGAYEFKYLALTYNDIYELNAANRVLLRHRAEHDSLTGVMNRGAFQQIREVLRVKQGPLALLLLDLDRFKRINDGWGRPMGDQILKKVAKLLQESFRATDFLARLEGDVFAAILTDVDPGQQEMIEKKILAINDVLLNPTDGLPPVSLSVGGAFSDSGFNDSLYGHAGTALHHMKANGRRGCRFYWEGMAMVLSGH